MGIELLLGLGLGFLILGPRGMHEMAGYLSRTKAQLAKAGRGLPSELEAELGRESLGNPPPAADPMIQSTELRPISAAPAAEAEPMPAHHSPTEFEQRHGLPGQAEFHIHGTGLIGDPAG
jgi:hypothetical protein